MVFLKKNFVSIFLITVFIFIAIYVNNRNQEAIGFLENASFLYTVCETTDYDTPGRGAPFINYIFLFKGINFTSWSYYELDFSKTTKEDLKSYVGKKYFVKFSIEKPQYSEIYLNKPVPEDFVYEVGQTWEKIPVSYD